MDKNFYLTHLDQLTDRERTILLYRIILKLPAEETSKRLKLNVKEIQETTKMLREQTELLYIKGYLMEAYAISIGGSMV